MSASVRTLAVSGLAALGCSLLVACGTPSPDPGSGSASGTAATSSSPSSPASASSSPGDIALRGTVGGKGLTCVSFVSTEGQRFALTGPGLPDKLVSVARSLGNRTDPSSAPGRPRTATVALVGHPVPGAMSTCNATVFSVTSATILSTEPK